VAARSSSGSRRSWGSSATRPGSTPTWPPSGRPTRNSGPPPSGQLDDRHALRSGTSVDDATDIVLALISIEVYLILTARGWSPERWEEWVTGMLIAALL
jgi:hypothetical protein